MLRFVLHGHNIVFSLKHTRHTTTETTCGLFPGYSLAFDHRMGQQVGEEPGRMRQWGSPPHGGNIASA